MLDFITLNLSFGLFLDIGDRFANFICHTSHESAKVTICILFGCRCFNGWRWDHWLLNCKLWLLLDDISLNSGFFALFNDGNLLSFRLRKGIYQADAFFKILVLWQRLRIFTDESQIIRCQVAVILTLTTNQSSFEGQLNFKVKGVSIKNSQKMKSWNVIVFLRIEKMFEIVAREHREEY